MRPSQPAPAHRPPAGLCLPCIFVRLRDGDTVEVRLPGSERVWAIRLINCWCPETRGPEKERGLRSKRHAEHLLRTCEGLLYVYIPAPADGINLLSNLTFDRIPGWLYVTPTDTLNELLVAAGLATREKSPLDGEIDG